jgi:CTP:molybdopterin cytidylyltransferase MocA
VVLLAAGASSRLGHAKQLVELDGETLVHRAAVLALATAPYDAVIVLGHAATEVAAAVRDLPLRRIVCAHHAQGMGASLANGLAALSVECEGALVLLCDQPGLHLEHLRGLLAAWRRAPDCAVASAYAGVRGVPALLPRSWFSRIEASDDRGARAWLREDTHDVIAVPCEALSRDIDTMDDLREG